MITNQEWNKLTGKKQDELSDEAFSYRQCEKCKDYYHLGEEDENKAEGMYLNSSDFECSEKKIIRYERKNNLYIDDNVFCWDCSKKLQKDLT
tara:strand:+ start:53 stop:328 length:276 start_codon:yes stop_codon:yes gene_type:complete